MQNFSFFEVRERDASTVVKSLANLTYNGRPVNVEMADSGEASRDARPGRRRSQPKERRRDNKQQENDDFRQFFDDDTPFYDDNSWKKRKKRGKR